ncbi:MAG: hypothetical protein IJT97_10485, partial [Bacteroidaceae bacterium]|nr:hypothetical protein [Bacteroidaceae bacterium]
YKNEANPLVFIPGTNAELYVTADYYVRTLDNKLSKNYTQVRQRITKKVTFTETLELNKMYSLVMHIGLTGVKFTATVSNWDVNDKGTENNFDSNDDGEKDIYVDDVYVPMNVSELLAVASPGTATQYGSRGGSLQIQNLALTYSDATDMVPFTNAGYTVLHKTDVGTYTVTIPNTAFAEYGITLSSSVGTFGADGYTLTLPANETAINRPVTITVTRGHQTNTFGLNQERGIVQSLALSLTPQSFTAADGGEVTPSVTGTFTHSEDGYAAMGGSVGTGSTSYYHDVTSTSVYGTTYTVDAVSKTLSTAGKLEVPAGAAGTVNVVASLTTTETTAENVSTTPHTYTISSATKTDTKQVIRTGAASASVASGGSETIYVAASTTSVTVNLTGLTASTAHDVSGTNNASGTAASFSSDGSGGATYTVTLTANNTASPVNNVVTIKESSDTKATITIVQAAN